MPSLLARALALTATLLHLAWVTAFVAVIGAARHHLPLFSTGPPPTWLLRLAGWAARAATAAETALLPGEAVIARRLAGVLAGSVDAALVDLGALAALAEADARRGGRGRGATAAALAARLGCDPAALFRLLRAGVATGVVGLAPAPPAKEAADPLTTVRFRATALTRSLGDPAAPAAAIARVHAAHLGPAYARLADAARSGTPAYSLAHGGTPFWPRLAAGGPAAEATFARAMAAGEGLISSRKLAAARAWARDAAIVDLGGAHGSLLARLLDLAGPATRGVLFDRPAVVDAARAAWAGRGRREVAFVGGDLFDPATLPPLGPGTAAVARFILHDWSDADAARLLRALRAAVVGVTVVDGPSGRAIAHPPPALCLIELVLPPGGAVPPHPALALADVNMLAALGGARERTAGEWAGLLAAGGWALVRVTEVGVVSLLEAVPGGGGGPGGGRPSAAAVGVGGGGAEE